MPSSYNQRRIKALSERGKLMAAARWKLDREHRDADEAERVRQLEEWEVWNLPRREGDPLGCLQWTDFRTGKVRRWTARIGDRIDRVTLHAPDGRATESHGWTWVLEHLRSYLCGRR